MTISKILIANRGEIVVRIARTCQEMGIQALGVYSDADQDAFFLRSLDVAVPIGGHSPQESYLDMSKIIRVAKDHQCDAIHPGFGFLSENSDFASLVRENGIIFIGPSSKAIAQMGNKTQACQIMAAAGVPIVPGYHGQDISIEELSQQAEKIGFPIMIKAAMGGGGKGMRIVHSMTELASAVAATQREAQSAFNSSDIFLEKYIENPRHLEVQILADSQGKVIHLFERECSIQRRHQKIIEESPSPTISPDQRHQLTQVAVRAAQAIEYENAGTVEFIFTPEGNFYFLEMNTRLQVEHAVTEMVTGIDIVAAQISIAKGESIAFEQEKIKSQGHSIELRLYSEDPENNFLPSTGTISHYCEPLGQGVRLDSGIGQGSKIDIYYDPMLAKLVLLAPDRAQAIELATWALDNFLIFGVKTNMAFLRRIINHEHFRQGHINTNFIANNESDLLDTDKTAQSKHQASFASEASEAFIAAQAWIQKWHINDEQVLSHRHRLWSQQSS